MVDIKYSRNTWKYQVNNKNLISSTQEIISEQTLKLFINKEYWLTFICTPRELEELVIGFLWDENIIEDLSEIDQITLSSNFTRIDVLLHKPVIKPKRWYRTTTGISMLKLKNISCSENTLRISPAQLITLYQQFNDLQFFHSKVGGFHSAALSDGEKIFYAVEDVGRHNCIDKIIGKYLREKNIFEPVVLLLSGRISLEMIHKIQRLNASIIISRTTPTSNAVEVAESLNITLIGYLRTDSFTIYSHPYRIKGLN